MKLLPLDNQVAVGGPGVCREKEVGRQIRSLSLPPSLQQGGDEGNFSLLYLYFLSVEKFD